MATGDKSMGYEQTLMYGRYTKELSEFARGEAARIRIEKLNAKQQAKYKRYLPSWSWCQWCQPARIECLRIKDLILDKIGEDWIFLTVLGVLMALLSFLMDYIISRCQIAHVWLYHEVEFSIVLQYLTWVAFPVVFILFSAGFVHLVAPNAIGSGIPEMKTILRGVVLKEYLTFRTLVSKMVGLCSSLGSGLPIGKEGPFVHIASIVATLLAKVVKSFQGIYENESRNSEMLSSACALGVACTFAAPIGGVLFSIEVTATYFAVRNYWRGFYTTLCGAMVFRLLAIWFSYEETITALLKTHLRHEFPFDPIELLAFAFIGLVCGLGGAMFVYLHRKIIYFNRKHQRLSSFLQKNRFLYPGLVAFLITTLTFPRGLGRFMAGELSYHEAIDDMFSNFTWTGAQMQHLSLENQEVLTHWSPPGSNIFVTLVLFIIMQFWMAAIANTLPVPAGVFIPVFAIGAAFGRLMGECMAAWFPYGIQSGSRASFVMPGGYAVVGAASLSGAVTHTISTSVIVFELTGQISHVLPAVIAVLLANAVCHRLQPSIYDSIIQIKQLPYLPDIQTKGGTSKKQMQFGNYGQIFFVTVENFAFYIRRVMEDRELQSAHHIYVEDFMIRDVRFISYNSTYRDVDILLQNSTCRTYPLVDSASSMILLGSIQRTELLRCMEEYLERDPRDIYVNEEGETTSNGTQRQQASRPKTPEERPRSILKHQLSPSGATTPSGGSPHGGSPNEGGSPVAPRKFQFTVESVRDEPSEEAQQSTIGSVGGDSLKKLRLPPDRVVDMTEDEQERWAQQQMLRTFDFEPCQVDPAPFQLVERTSLYKVHSLFALLSLSHAYVTNTGRLVGVVALKEVRNAVQGATQRLLEQKKARKRHNVQAPLNPDDTNINVSQSENSM